MLSPVRHAPFPQAGPEVFAEEMVGLVEAYDRIPPSSLGRKGIVVLDGLGIGLEIAAVVSSIF